MYQAEGGAVYPAQYPALSGYIFLDWTAFGGISADPNWNYQNEGVRKMVTAEREAVVGSPDLESLTTSHIERVFLTVRQELKRFQRKGLGYSKDLETHKCAIALTFGVYNFVRKHASLGTTPAVAAGIEKKRWSLERVVKMTEAYWAPKLAEAKADKALARRLAEDAVFEKAFAEMP